MVAMTMDGGLFMRTRRTKCLKGVAATYRDGAPATGAMTDGHDGLGDRMVGFSHGARRVSGGAADGRDGLKGAGGWGPSRGT